MTLSGDCSIRVSPELWPILLDPSDRAFLVIEGVVEPGNSPDFFVCFRRRLARERVLDPWRTNLPFEPTARYCTVRHNPAYRQFRTYQRCMATAHTVPKNENVAPIHEVVFIKGL